MDRDADADRQRSPNRRLIQCQETGDCRVRRRSPPNDRTPVEAVRVSDVVRGERHNAHSYETADQACGFGQHGAVLVVRWTNSSFG